MVLLAVLLAVLLTVLLTVLLAMVMTASVSALAAPAKIHGGMAAVGPATLTRSQAAPGQAPTVDVAAFWMDVTPVTKKQWLAFVNRHAEWRRGTAPRDLRRRRLPHGLGVADVVCASPR